MFTEDEAMEAWHRSGAVGHGVAGMQAAMTYAAEALAKRDERTLNPSEVATLRERAGAVLTGRVLARLSVLGARVAVLEAFAATAHGPEAWDGLKAKCSTLEQERAAAHERIANLERCLANLNATHRRMLENATAARADDAEDACDAAHQRLATMRDLIMKMGQLNVEMAKAIG